MDLYKCFNINTFEFDYTQAHITVIQRIHFFEWALNV